MEVALSAAVRHPHIVRVIAMNTEGLLLMELATCNLMQWYLRNAISDMRLNLHVLHQAASGLEHLHAQGLVHRDVKSANFLVFTDRPEDYPTIQLCDLGLAVGHSEEWRTTMTPQPGTVLSYAPEIHCGKPHARRTDVYSMGMVICEVLARRRPYTGLSSSAAMQRKMDGMLPCDIPPDCPRELRALIDRCLSLTPHDRPSMRVVRETIEGLLE